jgi:chromosome segregation ATPase
MTLADTIIGQEADWMVLRLRFREMVLRELPGRKGGYDAAAVDELRAELEEFVVMWDTLVAGVAKRAESTISTMSAERRAAEEAQVEAQLALLAVEIACRDATERIEHQEVERQQLCLRLSQLEAERDDAERRVRELGDERDLLRARSEHLADELAMLEPLPPLVINLAEAEKAAVEQAGLARTDS